MKSVGSSNFGVNGYIKVGFKYALKVYRTKGKY